MADFFYLGKNETLILDTTNNTIEIAVAAGFVNVYKDNQLVASLGAREIYTLPINTGQYNITNTATEAWGFIFRTFVY